MSEQFPAKVYLSRVTAEGPHDGRIDSLWRDSGETAYVRADLALRWKEEALAWRSSCSGLHGSQAACIDIRRLVLPNGDEV